MAEKEKTRLEAFWGPARGANYYISLPFNLTDTGPQPIKDFIELGMIVARDFQRIALSTSIDKPTVLNCHGVPENSPRVTICLVADHLENSVPSAMRIGQEKPSVMFVEPQRYIKKPFPGRLDSYTAVNQQNQAEVVTLSSVRAMIIGRHDQVIGQQVSELLLRRQDPKKSQSIDFQEFCIKEEQKDTFVVSRREWDLYTQGKSSRSEASSGKLTLEASLRAFERIYAVSCL